MVGSFDDGKAALSCWVKLPKRSAVVSDLVEDVESEVAFALFDELELTLDELLALEDLLELDLDFELDFCLTEDVD